MYTFGTVGIIADDLTGANDTALQFHVKGANTQILLGTESLPPSMSNTQVWAIATETRNVDAETSYNRVKTAVNFLKDNFNIEHYYKKIDSTLRGNIAVETLTILEELELDAAIILPAFPKEGRTTIGGYHLLKGIPIGRTEMARDPHSPIYESNINTILRKQLTDIGVEDFIGLVELDTVVKGAAPILEKINDLVSKNKKLIVVDAVSTVDIEQVALAVDKCKYKLLPTGSAGFAQALCNTTWLAEMTNNHVWTKIPKLPKLIISGSATELVYNQLQKLNESEDFDNTYFISLKKEDILTGVTDEIVQRIVLNLGTNNIVVVHSSEIICNKDHELWEEDISKDKFLGMITDYLSLLTKRVNYNKNFLLITLGGETSYKCAKAIDSGNLLVIDEVLNAIPLCMDYKAQWIVTKSGNLGSNNTLIDILRYFPKHESK